jgi:ABC-type amino acid transport substrate-binding protein
LTGIQSQVISSAEQLRGRPVAVLARSPGETFANRYGANVRSVTSLAETFDLLEKSAVDAVIFDRPQMQYFLKQRNASGIALSAVDYEQQNYGFALPLKSAIQHELNLHLLQMRESGGIDRVVEAWLGRN